MVSQSCDWELLPKQLCDAELQERVRVCDPPPQVWLQGLQAPHGDQLPLPDVGNEKYVEMKRKRENTKKKTVFLMAIIIRKLVNYIFIGS